MASTCFQQKRNSVPSTPLSDSASDDDLPSVKKIIARAGRAQKKPAIDLTGDNADHDFVVSWQRKPPRRLGITRS
jgi:hypothetical protein